MLLPKRFSESKLTFQITNLTGVIIQEKHFLQGKLQLQTLDVSKLKKGIYLLRVKNSKIAETIKFIKS